MEKKSNKNYFLIKLGGVIKFISIHLIVGLWLTFFFSLIELIITWQTKGLLNNFFHLAIISFANDLLYWLKYIWIIYLIFTPLIMLIEKPVKVLFKVFIILFFIIHVLLANYFNTALIPFLLKNVGGDAKLNQQDGIHPMAEGHKIVAQNVWEVLRGIL